MNGPNFNLRTSKNPVVQVVSFLVMGLAVIGAVLMGAVILAFVLGFVVIFGIVFWLRLWWLGRKLRRRAQAPADRQRSDTARRVIEVEYTVVEEHDPDRPDD